MVTFAIVLGIIPSGIVAATITLLGGHVWIVFFGGFSIVVFGRELGACWTLAAILLGLVLATVAPREPDCSRIDLEHLQVDKFAHDYYVRWALQHPDERCADATIERIGKAVDPRMTREELFDVWGKSISLACRPNGSFRGVYSFGPDGHDDGGENDDIASWKRPWW